MMIRLISLNLNKGLIQSTFDHFKKYTFENNIEFKMVLLINQDGITKLFNQKNFLTYSSISTYAKKNEANFIGKEISINYIFEINVDKDNDFRKLEDELYNYSILNVNVPKIPKNVLKKPIVCCGNCNWEGTKEELKSIDLGFGDIEDNTCPKCTSNYIKAKRLKIINKSPKI